MLEVFDLQRRKKAILENAFDRVETTEINAVGSFQFSLPADDDKNKHCQVFCYVRNDNGQLYRIIAPASQQENTPIKTYSCEHVIATLIDDVIFGQSVIGNLGTYTEDVINYILSLQSQQRWVLDGCDFRRQFEYAFENENLLAALMSVPNLFTEPYIWRYDTSSYPWKLSLRRIDAAEKPQFYIRAKKNLLSYKEEKAAQEICTKLYCLGYGEGINQLGIAEVNGGLPYLLAPQEKINQFGLISRIFVDRRFEDARSLLERGKAILAELQEPTSAKTFDVADLYPLTNDELDRAEVGKVARFTEDGTQTYITAVTKNHDVPGDMKITLATKAIDVASTVADLADRQRIEEVYSQGATQLYAQSIQANATTDKPARLNFYIPAEMRIINAVKLKIALSPFRSYSKSTKGGGASTTTSSSGGGTTATSSAGGGSNVTSSGGGSSNVTSSAGGSTIVTSSASGKATITSSAGGSETITSAGGGGETITTKQTAMNTGTALSTTISGDTGYAGIGLADASTGATQNHYHSYQRPSLVSGVYGRHLHRISINASHTHEMRHLHTIGIKPHTHQINIGDHKHNVSIADHNHTITMDSHTHSVKIPSHTHTVAISSHNHSIKIDAHTHSISIPDHVHDIEQGIFTFGSPSGAALYVNGDYRREVAVNEEMDITADLTGSSGKINRGAWQSVEIAPNTLAYVTIDMVVQGFIQSRGGTTV